MGQLSGELGNSKSTPMRILLKETSQERVLKAHENYVESWNMQVERRAQGQPSSRMSTARQSKSYKERP